MKIDLNSFVCNVPFTSLEIHNNVCFVCCPSWLPNKISSLEDIDKAWESEELKKVQQSILDGSYKYCSKTQCPYLSQLLIEEIKPKGFIEKEKFNIEKYKDGLIILSACLSGLIAKAIEVGEFAVAKQHIDWFKKTFKDDFYIEVMPHNEAHINKSLDSSTSIHS